jgi:Peptide methionine sulfoxide reductase
LTIAMLCRLHAAQKSQSGAATTITSKRGLSRRMAPTCAPVAEDTIADVEASGLWAGEVVTEISEGGPFWAAKAEDQDYLQRYPDGYTCHFPRPGWKLPDRETAA